MTPITYNNLVYFFGPDITHLAPTDLINIKIGLSGNNDTNFNQRLGEHQRHCPGDIAHAKFPTNGGDAAVRKYLVSTYPNLFGANRGKGREVIKLFVKDVPFLLDQATRYFNGDNVGRAKLNSFLLREEQKAALAKTVAFYQDPINIGREFLWDCKMRFGKTHLAYQLIMAMDAGLVLILTGRPTDTKKAWIEAMDHIDFDFGIDNFIDASKQGNVPITVDPNKRTIIFASLQDFARMTENGFKEKFANFPSFNFDLIIKDECHLSFDTEKTKAAIAQLQCKHVLNLSGTPFRWLLEERFSDDAKFAWSYIDEQRARTKEIATLGRELSEKEGQYYWLSPMKIFTILLSPELYEEVSQFTEDEGFTFTKLFHTEENNGKLVFRNDTAVKGFIDSLCHGFVMPYSKQAHNSHRYNSVNIKHALWYVSGVKEAKLLAARLKKHEIFKQYDIIIAAGDNGSEGNNTVELVTNRIAEIEAGRSKKHIGTITLSCGKLSHGVSIPEWGSILNLSDMKSAQLYFQLIFRGQTPWKGIKNECYVFDFNPNRTLTHIHTLAEAAVGTGDIKPILIEMLNVFNVLCYDGTEFKQVDASDLISKLESGFGRSTSMEGLQTLFSELTFDWDADLLSDLKDIEGGKSVKKKELKVNSNEGAPNGKNAKKGVSNNDADEEGENSNVSDDEEDPSDDQQMVRAKNALKAVPLYLYFTSDESFDSLIANLDINDSVCKEITGFQGRSLKKILNTQGKEKQKSISEGIMRFRSLEKIDHQARYMEH